MIDQNIWKFLFSENMTIAKVLNTLLLHGWKEGGIKCKVEDKLVIYIINSKI